LRPFLDNPRHDNKAITRWSPAAGCFAIRGPVSGFTGTNANRRATPGGVGPTAAPVFLELRVCGAEQLAANWREPLGGA